MPAQFSEVLLRDLRVMDAHCLLLQLGDAVRALFPAINRPVLHIILQGQAYIEVDDGGAGVWLRTGETALVFYGDRHAVRIDERTATQCETIDLVQQLTTAEAPAKIQVGALPVKTMMMSCALDLAYISPAALSIRAAPKIWPMRQTASSSAGRVLAGDIAQWRDALCGAGAAAFATMLASLHFIHMMRDIYANTWHDHAMEVRAPATRGLSAALQAIHLQPDRPWTVARLAQEVGLSRSRFSAMFTAALGMPPLAYLTKVRMERAAKLLEAETIPIMEAARRTGYAVPGSFARAFAAFHGMPPKQFVAQHRARA
jgi:AraC-like DNA-binding protein